LPRQRKRIQALRIESASYSSELACRSTRPSSRRIAFQSVHTLVKVAVDADVSHP